METMKKRTLVEGQDVFVLNQAVAGANYWGKARIPQGEQTFDDKTKGEFIHVIVTKFIDEDARELSGLKVGDIIATPVHAVYAVAPNKFCQGWNGERIPVCYEHFKDIDYPYYAPERDENMYEIEVETIDPNMQVPRKVQEKKGYVLKCRHFDSDTGAIDFEETIAISEKEYLIREKMNTLLAECFEDGWEKYNEGENFVSIHEGGESKEYEIEETIILS